MFGDVERARDLLRDGLVAAREIGRVGLCTHGFAALGRVRDEAEAALRARLG